MDKLSVLSWNCRGINNATTKHNIRSMISGVQPIIICLQETKCSNWDDELKNAIWDTKQHGWATSDSIGLSGGVSHIMGYRLFQDD